MQSTNRYKLGGNLLAGGASLALLLKAYWLFFPNENPFSMTYRVVGSLFGYWFAGLVMPSTTEGNTLVFSWTSLVWLPWAAVFIAFLLWIAVKVIKGQFKSELVPLPVLGVIGAWFFVGFLYDKFLLDFDFEWTLPMLLSNLATIAMIVGIGLILFSYKKAMTGAVDEVSQRRVATSSLSKNTEGKNGSQKYKWGFDWIAALIGMGVAGLFLAGMGKKYIDVFVNGDGGELAVVVGLVLVVMVGIIAGYGVQLIKRK